MLVIVGQALWLSFLIAVLAHVAAAITIMLFDNHHSMAATVVRSGLITIIIAPVLIYLLCNQRTDGQSTNED
ncbi:hypothetical protein JF546_17020 [Nitratireductor aquimarinus]|uniref:hypothetical protein n=1 Tax=Nitratireductor aquimarinus TaxID=889300 RepID=UPI001A8FB22F|nr:hypothetical protein [Nitratireductor aquimarinus]MBN8244720.1 hypothetical protein [Nitratireductor aquimarinus]MBY6133107.1 hypothetical protein [Nitratireductor aquimarinus]MCA1305041.1 hypothetical protein [Nitratireductor aquimarinus]